MTVATTHMLPSHSSKGASSGYKRSIQWVLKQQYSPTGGVNGILDLLNPNNIGPQVRKTAPVAEILRESKQEADNKVAQKGIAVTPKITL